MEKIPKGPVIFASNHLSEADGPILWANLKGNVTAMVMAEAWKNRWKRFLMQTMCMVPVERGNRESGREAIACCTRMIGEGWSTMIYPQGGISRDGCPRSFKFGVWKLAEQTGALVVPVRVKGTDKFLPDGGKLNRKALVTLIFGEPISTADFPSPAKFMDELKLRIQKL